jgi:hypothetical protein
MNCDVTMMSPISNAYGMAVKDAPPPKPPPKPEEEETRERRAAHGSHMRESSGCCHTDPYHCCDWR